METNAVNDEVRLEDASRGVWLVKAPPRVARLWDSVFNGPKSDDALLGNIRIHTVADGTKVEKITFRLADQDGISDSGIAAGRDFNLQLIDDKVPQAEKVGWTMTSFWVSV